MTGPRFLYQFRIVTKFRGCSNRRCSFLSNYRVVITCVISNNIVWMKFEIIEGCLDFRNCLLAVCLYVFVRKDIIELQLLSSCSKLSAAEL